MEINLTIRGDSDDADFKALLGHLASGCKGPGSQGMDIGQVDARIRAIITAERATHDTHVKGEDSASEPTKDPDPEPEPAAPPEPDVDYAALRSEATDLLRSFTKITLDDGKKATPHAMAIVKRYANAKDPDKPTLSEIPDENLSAVIEAAKAKKEDLEAQTAIG